MSRDENDPHAPPEREGLPERQLVPGGDDNGTELIQDWEAAAAETAAAPDYQPISSFDEYLAKWRPRTAARIEGRTKRSKQPRHGQARVLRRYDERHEDYVQWTEERNQNTHQAWHSDISEMFSEAYGLSVLADDDEAAKAALEKAEEWDSGLRVTDALGMALLAKGEPERAKDVLLARGSTHNLDNLLDAYRHTQDPDYRQSFIAAAHSGPYLLTRLFRSEQQASQSGEGILEAATILGAKVAIAATIVSSGQNSPGFEGAQHFLNEALPRLAPPKRTTIGAKDRAVDAIREEGAFGVFDAAFEGMDFIMGGSVREKSPEYIKFLKEVAPVVAVLAPLLATQPGYQDQGFGDLDRYKFSTQIDILRLRSDWGDKTAGPQLLSALETDDEVEGLLPVYRNILRDVGPVAAVKYLPLLPPEARRPAIYHTLIRKALGGQAISAPHTLPEVVDDFASLQTLYHQAGQLAVSAEDSSALLEETDDLTSSETELAKTNVEAMVDLTELANSRRQDVQALIRSIKSMNDPEREARLLKVLIEKLTLPE